MSLLAKPTDGMDDIYEIDAENALVLIANLIQLILAFVGPEKAKALIDQEYALSINAQAEELERKRFGN